MAASPLPEVLKTVIAIHQDDDDWFLVNLERGNSLLVDGASKRIFECCRTCASVEAVAHDLATELAQSEDEMLRRVRTAIERFRASGLCAGEVANQPPPPSLTAA